jgi:hypothetical protein
MVFISKIPVESQWVGEQQLRDNVQVSFTIFVQIHEGASVTI